VLNLSHPSRSKGDLALNLACQAEMAVQLKKFDVAFDLYSESANLFDQIGAPQQTYVLIGIAYTAALHSDLRVRLKAPKAYERCIKHLDAEEAKGANQAC
jgi:hypothetical protein